MAVPNYRTAPLAISTMPPGVPYIVGNEAAERFSYYGMKAILFVYMTSYLKDWSGQAAPLSENVATSLYHAFGAALYTFPLLGALLADWVWGKYRTILWLSIVYCFGHLALAVVPAFPGLILGLILISIGSGGIKPCVSAHVGDQFGPENQHLLTRVFGWFYFSINFGSFFAFQFNPILLKWGGTDWGPHLAFGLPGIAMMIATFVFWMGRHRFVHIPPGRGAFLKEVASPSTQQIILKLIPLYLFVSVFWSLYEQTGSAWVAQANEMDRRWLGIEWESAQIGAVNPILVMLFIPLFNYMIFPAIGRVMRITPLGKVSVGFFLTAASFAVSALIEHWLVAGSKPNIVWQLVAYTVLTAAEVLVYGTCLEFSYTQAPRRMKSLVMGLFLLTVAIGNGFTSLVNFLIVDRGGKVLLDGPAYYWFFTSLMGIAAIAFLFVARRYREQTFIQQSVDSPVSES